MCPVLRAGGVSPAPLSAKYTRNDDDDDTNDKCQTPSERTKRIRPLSVCLRTNRQTDRHQESNLVHFSLKM